jgi:dihydropteroate synthase
MPLKSTVLNRFLKRPLKYNRIMTICCHGRLIELTAPKVMGILNTTPDSFYDGGRYTARDRILARAETLLAEGADFIDIGGYSSRPGAVEVSEDEEIRRVVPAIRAIMKAQPEALISVDTFRSEVARQALDAGAALVNDITAGHADPRMLPLIAQRQVPYIMMHMRGTPQTMSGLTDYQELISELISYFSERLYTARDLGIIDCIADPGFGFAKTLEQNFEILGSLEAFLDLDIPILAGLSRKSMIYKTLGLTAADALNGTTALNMIALEKGANILRVHDVKEAVECVRLWKAIPR